MGFHLKAGASLLFLTPPHPQAMTFIMLLLLLFAYIFAIAGVIFFDTYTRSDREDLEYKDSFRLMSYIHPKRRKKVRILLKTRIKSVLGCAGTSAMRAVGRTSRGADFRPNGNANLTTDSLHSPSET